MQNLSNRIEEDALAIGVDVTWHGGSNRVLDQDSRHETIAFAKRTKGSWDLPQLKRIELSGFNPKADKLSPNSDPEGIDLANAINSVITEHGAKRVAVIALDAPLETSRVHLPRRQKVQQAGEVERRGCDRDWSDAVKSGDATWKGPNIQPGAPLPPRIDAIVDRFRGNGIPVFRLGDAIKKKVLIECFPNEAIWATGILGYAPSRSYKSMTAYKRMGRANVVVPIEILSQIVEYTLTPTLNLIGVPASSWVEAIWSWLAEDAMICTATEGKTGKGFDDAIDSVFSLSASVAFADGKSHVFLGSDKSDGHIVGPGIFTS